MPDAPAHWFILGAGSIGCLYAAYLQRAHSHQRTGAATLLLRDRERLDAFHAAGLTLQLDDVHWPVPIGARTVDETSAAMPRIERLLLCTKAHHSRDAIAAVQAHLAADAVIVLLQNGMGVREEVRALLPHAVIMHALSTEGAWQPQRFHVVHAGHGETVLGAGADDDAPARGAEAARQFAGDLQRSGLQARVVDAIEPALWQKLAVNCVINPLTALHRCRNGELLAQPDFEDRLGALCREIAAVAAAHAVTLDAAALMARVRDVAQRTAGNRSSMLQDVLAGRTTEVAYLNGFIAREAQRLGLSAAANAALLHAIEALSSA